MTNILLCDTFLIPLQPQVKSLCEKAKEILSKESNVQEVSSVMPGVWRQTKFIKLVIINIIRFLE